MMQNITAHVRKYSCSTDEQFISPYLAYMRQ